MTRDVTPILAALDGEWRGVGDVRQRIGVWRCRGPLRDICPLIRQLARDGQCEVRGGFDTKGVELNWQGRFEVRRNGAKA